MIVILLEIITGIAILLGAAIAVASGYLFYQNKIIRSADFVGPPKVPPNVDERMDRIVDLIDKFGSQKGLVESYFQLKNDAVSFLDLGVSKNLTEREIIQALKAGRHLKPVENSLERIYRTYERARFGSHALATGEFDLLLEDVRLVYSSLAYETNLRQGTG